MTRLTTRDIQNLPDELSDYENRLISLTGCTLRQLACDAVRIAENKVCKSLDHTRFGVVPMTVGGGVISGFSQAVSAIANHMGANSFVTTKPDVAGVAEAIEKNADNILFADDDRFIALNLRDYTFVDNAEATGKGFVAGLELMAGSLNQRNVLVLGCGPVGQSAVRELLNRGSRVHIVDPNNDAIAGLKEALSKDQVSRIQHEKDIEKALDMLDLILDATPVGRVILERHVTPQTIVSAPGVPLGVEQNALTAIADRLLHDPLQIGVATMIVESIRK